MTTMDNVPRLPQDVENTGDVNGAPPDFRAITSSETALLLPLTNLTVLAVIDGNGYLMPLCTAGDLLRWCKAAWRAEQDR